MIHRFLARKSLAFGIFAAAFSHAAAPDPARVFGTYLGYLEHDRLDRVQAVRLDFIMGPRDSSRIRLSAVLSLQFGGFGSGEYVAYHYENVIFDVLTGRLTFEQSDQNAILSVERFDETGLHGVLSSAYAARVGRIHLTRTDRLAPPTRPLVGALSGEYRGLCGPEEAMLQLHAFRSSEDTFQVGNPFGAYTVKGALAIKDPAVCYSFEDAENQKSCVATDIQSAAYNFFTGDLTLAGSKRNLACRVGPKGELDCGSCRFEKTRSEENLFDFPATQSPPYFDVRPRPDSGPREALSGEYSGYLHHERLDKFQRARLNLNLFHAADADGSRNLKIAASANLYFGEFGSPQVLSYRFDTIPFPNPLFPPQFMLSRHASDVDATLRVTFVGRGVIRGEWYSLMFGRVGTFEFRKRGLPAIRGDRPRFESLEGFFGDREWEMSLAVGLGRTPINSNNPFDPLKVSGYARYPQLTGKIPFRASSYDFYVDRLALLYDPHGVIVIERDAQQRLLFRHAPNVFGGPLQSYDLRPLERKARP